MFIVLRPDRNQYELLSGEIISYIALNIYIDNNPDSKLEGMDLYVSLCYLAGLGWRISTC